MLANAVNETSSKIGAINRFLNDQRGNVILLVAVLAVPMVLMTGLAVDTARGYLVKARLGDALDSAGLAATAVVTDPDRFDQDFDRFFDSNFPPNYLGADVTFADPVISTDGETVTFSAMAQIDTTFMHLVGDDTLTITASSEITRRMESLDVVLSMDMSGSMQSWDGVSGSKIRSARRAARTLIDVLFGASNSKDLLNIGLVPWNAKVNVTDDSAFSPASTVAVSVPAFVNPMTGLQQTEIYYPSNSPVPLLANPIAGWNGCVYARYLDDGNQSNDADLTLGPIRIGGADWPAWQGIGPEGECGSCTSCLRYGITRLTNQKATITNAVRRLRHPQGSTNIVQGLAWAYRVLSPGEPFPDADPNPRGGHRRAIVLLTDGEHHGYIGDAYNGTFGVGHKAGPNGLNQRLLDLADQIKAQGVEIYVIQYLYHSSGLAGLLQDVASDRNAPYYYFAPDGHSLNDIFQEVANHLSDLRVSR